MSLAGAVNGTKVKLEIEDTPGGGTWTVIGGETSHTLNNSRELIDISNKSAENQRCYLENEGTVTSDITVEIIYSSDAVLAQLKAALFSGDPVSVRRVIGTSPNKETIAANYMVQSNSDTAGLNAALSSSISLVSTGPVTRTVA